MCPEYRNSSRSDRDNSRNVRGPVHVSERVAHNTENVSYTQTPILVTVSKVISNYDFVLLILGMSKIILMLQSIVTLRSYSDLEL